ncbi:MAG: glycoside hydrolase family 38 C-terminal domain-containing protein [Candidatus Zixiibacteriota bacterium]
MRWAVVISTAVVLLGTAIGHSQSADETKSAEKPILQVVATSHLDTQWRWSIRTTIDHYIPATFADNFRLLDQFPHYTFSFEGAFRYMLLKEYRPDLYARLGPYVAARRWRLAGSWIDAVDVDMPSFESLVRQTLYGNGFFKREFGVTSRDVLLPDCFGFGYALPSIAAHCGLKSFSTQKLTWGSSVGVPFHIGLWEGVDGSVLAAALSPGDYVSEIEGDLTKDSVWIRKAKHQSDTSGLAAAYRYFGTGDTGGAPAYSSVEWLEQSQQSDGPLSVRSVGSDDLVDLVSMADARRLPRYRGELLMTRHAVGCYTSQAAMKRWNRKNEMLADATERAAVMARILGGADYPRDALRATWIRFLWHQFHDDLTGTSIPEAYEFSWNDEILCQNRFAGMLTHAVEAISPRFDTWVVGVPLLVYNPLAFARQEVVTATVTFPSGAPATARVFAGDGREVPSQVVRRESGNLEVTFLADVPSVGCAVYDVRPAQTPCAMSTGLSVTAGMLENHRYRVTVDPSGNVISIVDKSEGRELLASPIRWELLFDKPNRWPSWEIDYDEISAPSRTVVGGPAEIEIVEKGPARVALAVTRRTGTSVFHTTISLAAGDTGDRVAFTSEVDWQERETLLKAAFPLTTANEYVTYDLGLGTIQRRRNHPLLYEVPGQQWADLTTPHGEYGVAILNDCKYGWDHPDSATVRLSLIHTPGVFDSWSWVGDQSSQDIGHHRFAYALVGHRGDWRHGAVVARAACFNQPLRAFQVPRHEGPLGKSYSLLLVSCGDAEGRAGDAELRAPVVVNTIKMAEDSDELIFRLRETEGVAAPDVRVHFAVPIVAAREVNGAEESMAIAPVSNGELRTSLGPYQPRAFAVRLQDLTLAPLPRPECRSLPLPFDLDGISLDDNRRDGDFDAGHTVAGELLPDTLVDHDIMYTFGSTMPGAKNVLSCHGQSLPLPSGSSGRLCLLATAVGGPASGTFSVDGHDTTLWIQDYAQPIGQWNDRLATGSFTDVPERIAPAYINRAPVAWYGTHRHSAAGENEAYQFTYLYSVSLPLPLNAQALTLPANPRIRLLAATVAKTPYDDVRPVEVLYDATNATVARIVSGRRAFVDSLVVGLACPVPGAELHYTLDNSTPQLGSPVYAGPIVLTSTATIKARALKTGADDSYVAANTFHRLGLRAPSSPEGTVPGLACSYYEGYWDSLPGFDTLKVLKTVVLDSVTTPTIARKEDFGLVLRGFVQVPTDGLYRFALSSDDGSDLSVDDTLLVDNDGLHGMGDVSGEVGLKAGLHAVTIRMFQKKGDRGLALSIEGPRLTPQAVPPGWFYHNAADTPGRRR